MRLLLLTLSNNIYNMCSKFFSFLKRISLPTLGLGSLVLIWHLLCVAEIWSRMILPSPVDVASYLYHATLDMTLLSAILVTVKRLLVGYFLGIVIGIPLGVLCARSLIFRDTLGLVALGLQALPSVCWVPLAIIWFGQTESAMLFVVLMGTVWSLIMSTAHGVTNIPPIYVRAAKTMGSRGLHTWVKVIMPAAFPSIVGGMKQGWAFAWRSLMAAEIYVVILTGTGLGQLLHYGRELQSMDQVIAIMLIVVIIGLLADKFIFSPWEASLRTRWGF